MFTYHVFGLDLVSDIDFSRLFPPSAPLTDDSSAVLVRLGNVPNALPNATVVSILYQIASDQFWFEVPHVARYWVKQGREIIVQPAPDSDEDSVMVFFQNTALSALFHQRRTLHMRASCIETPEGAIMFAGDSSVGKSTLTALFQRRGYRVICDDIAVLSFDDQGIPYILSGYPQLKLWRMALDRLGGVDLTQLRPIRPGVEKYNFPVEASFRTEAQPLKKIYFLGYLNLGKYECEPIPPILQLPTMMTQVYQQRIALEMGVTPAYWGKLASMIGKISMLRLNRPSVGFDFDSLASLVQADENKQ